MPVNTLSRTGRQPAIGFLRLAQRRLAGDGDKGIDARIGSGDAVEKSLRRLDGAALAALKPSMQCMNGQIGQFHCNSWKGFRCQDSVFSQIQDLPEPCSLNPDSLLNDFRHTEAPIAGSRGVG